MSLTTAGPAKVAGSAGNSAVGAGAAGSAGASPGVSIGAAGMGAGAAGQASAASGSGDAKSFAGGLAELFLDAQCEKNTPTPLADGATCNHPPNTQRIEKPVTFGGETGKNYQVKLRVRGIWEPTNITGGQKPDAKAPFTVGGKVTSGSGSSSDAINYQQYFIEVAEPKQTYWLNNYPNVGHVIHKEDYEATITVAGGAQLKVVMNDGNEREIANFPKELFSDLPPYDKQPSLGQSLRLDVLAVAPAP